MEVIFDNIIILSTVVLLFYIAYKIGALVLKIAIGMAAVSIVILGLNRIWTYVSTHFISGSG